MRKPIKGYEGEYEVDDSGFIFSLKSNKFLKAATGNSGYLAVSLSKDGHVNGLMVHRVVAIAFIDNPENKKEVNHKDYNKLNNNVNNLEWCTPSENSIHGLMKPNRRFVGGMKGKLGKSHNRSLPIYEFDSNMKLVAEYESGLDFQRKTGKNHSSPSWSIKTRKPIFGMRYSRTPSL